MQYKRGDADISTDTSCEPVEMAKEDPTEIFQEGLDPGRLLGPRGRPEEGCRIPFSARAVVSPGLLINKKSNFGFIRYVFYYFSKFISLCSNSYIC